MRLRYRRVVLNIVLVDANRKWGWSKVHPWCHVTLQLIQHRCNVDLSNEVIPLATRLIQHPLTTDRVIIPLIFRACPASFPELDKFWQTSRPSQRFGQIIWILRRTWNPCPLGNYSTFIHHSHRTCKCQVTQWPAGEVYWWWRPLGWSFFSEDSTCRPQLL